MNNTLWVEWQVGKIVEIFMDRHQQIFQNETEVHARDGEEERRASTCTCSKVKMSLRPTKNSVGTSQSNLGQP